MASIMKTYSNYPYAVEEFNKIVDYNKGRGGQYKHAYLKSLKSGKYEIGLLKSNPKNPNTYNRLVKL